MVENQQIASPDKKHRDRNDKHLASSHYKKDERAIKIISML